MEFAFAQITTGYNLEDDRCECVALQDYKKNEQVNAVTWSSVLPVRSSVLLTTMVTHVCVEAYVECDLSPTYDDR